MLFPQGIGASSVIFEGKALIPGSELKPGNPFQTENFRKVVVAVAREMRRA